MIPFLRTFLIILIVYYLFKLVVRLIFPLVLKMVINNMQHDTSRRHAPTMKPKAEGEISIEQKETGGTGRKGGGDDGEYVDYEEVK